MARTVTNQNWNPLLRTLEIRNKYTSIWNGLSIFVYLEFGKTGCPQTLLQSPQVVFQLSLLLNRPPQNLMAQSKTSLSLIVLWADKAQLGSSCLGALMQSQSQNPLKSLMDVQDDAFSPMSRASVLLCFSLSPCSISSSRAFQVVWNSHRLVSVLSHFLHSRWILRGRNRNSQSS